MLEVKNATKCFGTFKALDHLSLTVPKGAVYGLVGPNGAGKTTAIRLMLGIYTPEDISDLKWNKPKRWVSGILLFLLIPITATLKSLTAS